MQFAYAFSFEIDMNMIYYFGEAHYVRKNAKRIKKKKNSN